MNAIPPRFVILRHTPGPQGTRGQNASNPVPTHFDWMFEAAGALKTWATEPIASFQQGISMKVEKLADHRVHYLDFEGDIGGGRGEVQQILSGHYQVIEEASHRFLAELRWVDAGGSAQSQRVEIGSDILRLGPAAASVESP